MNALNKSIAFLVGCEESQAITIELRALGVQAFSCDLKPCSGGHPEWHIQGDVFDAINDYAWDAAIFHPVCTYLAVSGSQWLSHPDDIALPFEDRRPNPKYPNRRKDMLESVEFVKKLYNCGIKNIAIENPIGLLSSRFMKPTQIIQPYHFGDEATKPTCLWLKGFKPITPTKIVGKGERERFSSGKSHPKWYSDALKASKNAAERRELRSKTFSGMAKAMAEQFTKQILKNIL